MRNFKNNRRRFRSNSFERGLKINSNDQSFNSNIGNVSDFKKKNYHRNNFNSSKLIQKYSDLAREALSIGDKILYENYMQHAEHFVRLSENNSNFSNNKSHPSRYLPENKNTKNVLFNDYKNKLFRPTEKEIDQNNRSRSAKLRFAIRNKNKFIYPKELSIKFEKYLELERLND